MRHGYSAFSNGTCRCAICRQAGAEYRRKHRAVMRGRLANLTHGLRSTYDAGCRCDECRAVRRHAYLRERAVQS